MAIVVSGVGLNTLRQQKVWLTEDVVINVA